jgi:hypothetical protein
VVLYSLRIVPLRQKRAPKVPVRRGLPRPVAHLLCNRQVQRVALDGHQQAALVGVSTSSGNALALVPGLPRLGLAATEGKGAGWGGTRR